MFKQTFATLVALSSLNSVAAAQTPAGQIRAATQTPTCATPSVADKAELKLVPGTDLMTVPVVINGTPKQFLLDIGTKPDEVSAVAVKELALPPANRSTDTLPNGTLWDNGTSQFRNLTMGTQIQAAVFDVGGSRTAQDYQARVGVASFTIGDATGHNLQFLVANDRDMGKSEPYDGLLTASFFAQYDIDFDFSGKQLSFLAPTRCTDPDQVAYWPHTAVAIIPMTISSGKISVPVMINGHQINAVLDTGSAHTVMRRDIAELILGLKADTPDMTPAGDTEDGMGMQVYNHTFSQISFAGGVTAVNVPTRIQANSMVHKINRTPILGSRAQFADDPSLRIPDLALGMDVLHQLHLYAAFGENKLYVTSAE